MSRESETAAERITEEFIDVETAKTSGRKQFDRIVQVLARSRSCRTVLVEKTDRLYRNFRDAVTLEDLDVEVHLVKEGQIISKDARSQAKLIHGMQLVLARNYVENLREEVKKGMREKAEQGIYPGRAPFGYKNNKADRTIEIHAENALLVQRIFELYATGQYPLLELRAMIRQEFGKTFAKSYLHTMLKNPSCKLLDISSGSPEPSPDNYTFMEYSTGMYLRRLVETEGMQAAISHITRLSKRNKKWALEKFADFLPVPNGDDLTNKRLFELFQQSLAKQLQSDRAA